MAEKLVFDKNNFEKGSVSFRGEMLDYRKYSVTYVQKPNAPELQTMNIYVREDMADDHDSSIFLIQRTGGMGESMPFSLEMEDEERNRKPLPGQHAMPPALNDKGGEKESVIARLLFEKYVVASPGARGRDTVVNGEYVGRGEIPMTIIDLKAAVRYLHYNKGLVPGNTDKIICEGASSGGGMSALLGATGNSAEYEPFLDQIGAAKASDSVYCCIVDSPITDFGHIDTAYEWQFGMEYANGLFANEPKNAELSRKAAEQFVCYVDSLELKNPENGAALSIRDESYTEYFMKMLDESLNIFLDEMTEQERRDFIEDEKNASLADWSGEKAKIKSFEAYINWNAGRWMRYIGCYDGFPEKPSRENEAFKNTDCPDGHFSVLLGKVLSETEGFEKVGKEWCEQAEKNSLAAHLLNPLDFIGKGVSDCAPYWYVRCGGHHETTGALFLNLALRLLNNTDSVVDARVSWPQRHTCIALNEIDETVSFLRKNQI